MAAVQRVTDAALLERIAEATKHRDNRVYQYSYDLLRARRRGLARATQAAQLAAGFRGLIESPPEARSLADPALYHLIRIWMANRGVWESIASAGPTVSFAMDDSDIDFYLAHFRELARTLTS